MHPKVVEFVTGALSVIPPDIEWQLSYEQRRTSWYLRTPGPDRMSSSVAVTREFMLDQPSPSDSGRHFMLKLMKGLKLDAVHSRDIHETPQSRSPGV